MYLVIVMFLAFSLSRIQPLSGQISAVTQVHSQPYSRPPVSDSKGGGATTTSPDLSQQDSSTPHASADVQSHLITDISGGGGEGGGGDKVEEGLAPAADCCIPGGVFSGVGEFPPTERPLSSVGGEEGGGVGGPKPPAPPRLRDLEMRQVKETALR